MNLPIVSKSFSRVSKAILIGAVSVCFAGMVPSAFAQRGGGGHVGGGGGHIGGVHAAGGFSGGSRASAGHVSVGRARSGSRTVSASGSTNRGYSRTYFVAPPSHSGGVSTFLGVGTSAPLGQHVFAGSNRLWEAPPQQRGTANAPHPAFMPAARPLSSPAANPFVNTRFPNAQNRVIVHRFFPASQVGRTSPVLAASPFIGMSVMPSHHFAFNNGLGPFFNSGLRFHPIGPGPCAFGNCGFFGAPFFNPFFFSGFGFGFSPCFGGGFGCGFGPFGFGDLAWGWGDGLYGYGNGWFYPPAEEPPPPPENPTEDNAPPNYAPDYYFVPPPDEAAAAPAQPQQPVVKLVLKDGTIFGVYSYWMQDNRLFYVTTYNIKTSISIGDLDLQKTVDLNSKLGVNFSLSHNPPGPQEPPDQQQ